MYQNLEKLEMALKLIKDLPLELQQVVSFKSNHIRRQHLENHNKYYDSEKPPIIDEDILLTGKELLIESLYSL